MRSLNELSNRAARRFDSLARVAAWGTRAVVASAFPMRCALCNDASADALLCVPCMNALPPLGPACPVCALPSPGGVACGRCLVRRPHVSATIAACAYAFPLDRLVQELKYGHRLALAVPLGDALAAAVLRAPASVARAAAIVPMPLSRPRQRERGFNQAIEIARIVSRRCGVPMLHALRRPLHRPAQAGLPWRERRRNVRGAFVAAAASIVGRHVAIVDDVMTTGATIEAAAGTLLAAGAARVDAWVVARAMPPRDA